MDKFECIQAFVRVAETLSFAEAARQLNVTPSVITSRVKKLEAFVQSPLFHRSTRAVTLSEAGSNFFAECAEIVSHVDSAMERMRLIKGTPTGVLRLQVLPGFALGHLGSALKDFSSQYPQIELDITVSDVPVNPVDKGYDVALQVFKPAAETLIERSLFPVRRVFCASPSYLRKHGTPREPADLHRYRLGLYSAYPTRDRWTFRRGDDQVSLQLPAAIRTNSVHMLRDFALSGGGITCLPTLVCGDYLLSNQLVRVVEDYEIPPLELLAIYPATHRRALKVKLFVEFITTRFSGEPVWDRALRDRSKERPRIATTKAVATRSKRSGTSERNESPRRNNADPKD
ncbi:DNA-binding transcriptional LysR family regulator [Povalibacter uvarum]|uniref:DNA-binding transcriptional LysR family regulator n=1 Tax=Povalibacter uvarum TaxID=732238 RepID=A0A841HUX7_9GAMM|nr:LysR family transcriptional regulator [Povalibacter uvarum]MBB6096464.1 DNA-binding transcriptional LysR family regulator [Povalibacter uvarum]